MNKQPLTLEIRSAPMKSHLRLFAISIGAIAVLLGHASPTLCDDSRPAHSLLNTMLENTGGRAEIVHVTNLDAEGPGSFAEAITGGSNDVTRIVVFDVSGEIVLPKAKRNIRGRITTDRKNLWIAGQTAPATDGGSARGVTLRGMLQHRQGPFVIEHIRIRPVDGRGVFDRRNEDGRGLLFAPNCSSNGGRGGPVGFVLWRNVSVEWTQDVIGAIGGSSADGPDIPYAENVCVDNCLFAEPINWKIADRAGDYDDGHSYGLNVRGAAFRVLIRGTLHASAFNRTPQFCQCSSGMLVNNYTFNFGFKRTSGRNWFHPLNLNPKSLLKKRGRAYFADPGDLPPGRQGIRLGAVNNYAEGGNRTDIEAPYEFLNPFHVNRTDEPPYAGPIEYYDRGNHFSTHYDMTKVPGLGWDQVNTAGPHDEPVIDAPCATPVFTREPHRILDEPPFPLTSTLYKAHEARDHCLAYAGAWPGKRDATDARIIAEVQAKTHRAVGASVDSDAPMTSRLNAPPFIPNDPGNGVIFDRDHPLLQVERNGLTRLENWLISRHLEAGGCLETLYDAPEWLTHPAKSPGQRSRRVTALPRRNAGPVGDDSRRCRVLDASLTFLARLSGRG